MSFNNRPQGGNANKGDIRSSKSKSNNDYNQTSLQANNYVIQRSGEWVGSSQIENEKHPIISAKKKIMNLTSVVGSHHLQVSEMKALQKLVVKTNGKVVKPHESITYSSSTRGYQPRTFRPQIPDTWGQEPTGPLEHKKTVVKSTSRDHPYTPTKRENLVARSKKIVKEAIKSQKNMKVTSGAGSTWRSTEVRIRSEEKFNKFNEEIASKIHQDETTAAWASETILTQDEEEPAVETVNLYPSEDKLIQASNDEIKNSVPRNLSVDKFYLVVHTPNGSFCLQVSNDPSLEEFTKIIGSLQSVPLHKDEFEPKPGSSKEPDAFVMQKLESSDSLNDPFEVTESIKQSELSDVECSRSDAFHEDNAITYKLANFSSQFGDSTSSVNSQVVPFTSVRLKELEYRSHNLSSRFALPQNEVIFDEAFSSLGQVSKVSENRQDLGKELPTSIALSSSISRSLIELPKISPICSDSFSIAASVISFEGTNFPSFLPATPTPVPQKISCLGQIGLSKKVQLSKVDVTEACNQMDKVQTIINTNASKIRQEDVYFGNRQQTFLLSVFLNSANSSMLSLALKLTSLNNQGIYISNKTTCRSLDILINPFFFKFPIFITCTVLCISNNEQPTKHFSLGNFLHTVIGQVTGTFELKLFSVIINFFRMSIGQMVNVKTKLQKYHTIIVHRDIILLINPLITDLMNPIIRMSKNKQFIFEIILPNPTYFDNCQIRSIQFIDEVIPLYETIWTEATQLFASCYKALKNSVILALQMVESLSSVLTIPRLLGILGVTLNEQLPLVTIFKVRVKPCVIRTDDLLTGVKYHILGILLPLTLTQKLLTPINAPINIVKQQWQLRWDFATLLAHDAINPTLVLLLRC